MISADNAAKLLAQGEVLGSDDHSIGRVSQVYVDGRTNTLTWVTVKASFFGNKEFFIPLDRATFISNILTVPYDRGFVDSAPKHEYGHELSVQDEDELCGYYQMPRHAPTADGASEAVDSVISTELTGAKVAAGSNLSRRYVVPEQQPVDVPGSIDEIELSSRPD